MARGRRIECHSGASDGETPITRALTTDFQDEDRVDVRRASRRDQRRIQLSIAHNCRDDGRRRLEGDQPKSALDLVKQFHLPAGHGHPV